MPQYRRKTFKRTGRKLKQFKAYPSMGSGFATAAKMGIAAAGMTNAGRRIANRLMGMRKQAASMTKTLTKSKGLKSKNYGLRTEANSTVNLAKRMTKFGQLNKIVRSNLQYVIYRWNGVKSFDDHGYYWFSNFNTPGLQRALPLYLFDLTACRNIVNGTSTASRPLVQAYMNPATGGIYFLNRANQPPDGAVASSFLQLETTPQGSTSGYLPFAGDILKWANVQLNLWGCKNRSTKYTIQIVRFKEADLVPDHDNETITSGNDERTALFQSILKPYVFNPLSKTSGVSIKKLHVYKSQSHMIDSTMSTETDQDPHVKTVKMWVKMDRRINYVESSDKLNTATEFADSADYATNVNSNQYKTQTDPLSRVYLMLVASNYVADETENNADTPSFDLQVQLKHTNLN